MTRPPYTAAVQCHYCDALFPGGTPGKRYCSRRCKKLASARRIALHAREGRTCGWCGKPAVDAHRTRYCSLGCATAAAGNVSANARLRNGVPAELDLRIGFISEHIGRRMEGQYRRLLLGDPSYCGERGGSCDHIEATGIGGADGWANLTAACGSCNSAKIDRPLLHFVMRRRLRLAVEPLLRELASWGDSTHAYAFPPARSR